MTTEIIYQGKKIEVIAMNAVQSTCNGGEKIKAQSYCAVDKNEDETYIVLEDNELGNSVIEYSKKPGKIANFEKALDEMVDILCAEKGCRGGSNCIKKAKKA